MIRHRGRNGYARQLMPKIFVCHRSEDTANVAGRIFDRLVMNYGGQQILKDLDSIPLGVDFREYLGRMVGECDVFLAVVGPRWLDGEGDTSRLEDPRDFVRIEIESALTREIPVVPLFVGGASMPSEEDVPESIRPFVYRNGVPVRPDPDFHGDMDRVIAGLDGYGRQAPPPPAETAAPIEPDCHRDAERERVRAEAELTTLADKLALTTLAEELAVVEERHRAEIARLETEAADSGAVATLDVQIAAELERVRADAQRPLAEERQRTDIASIEVEAGMIEIPAPSTAGQAPTVLIVAADEVQTVKSELGFEKNIRVFADTDAIGPLQYISICR